MIVADTDVLIDALEGGEPAASAVARGIRQRRLATTAISRFELLDWAPAGPPPPREAAPPSAGPASPARKALVGGPATSPRSHPPQPADPG